MTDAAACQPGVLLRLRGVTKRFAGVTALENVDFELRHGEIHALLGENGAGKSTLIKVLGGIHIPEAGTMEIDGGAVTVRGVADADRLGIRIIHQELSLAPNLSIAANIYLGRESCRRGFVLHGRMEADARELVRSLGLEELSDVRATVGSLNVARQQLVEIARALSARARILVLDEPTSALSEAETESLFATLDRLRAEGVGIIYISHRLDEIRRLADRITVLRDGRSIGTQASVQVDRGELIRWMIGREVEAHSTHVEATPGAVALEVGGLRGEKTFGVDLSLRHGEVLGLAGLMGSGRSELARILFGIDPCYGGSIQVDGRPVRIRSPRDALEAGIVLVPEDRKREGLVLIESIGFNLAIPWVDRWIRGCFPDRRRRADIVNRAIDEFGIRASSPRQCIGNLSGGNQQKAMVGRWMEQRPKILLLDEPTRGVDVGAREDMFRIIGRLVAEGMAVLWISSDLEEVLHLSHRVAMLRDGRVVHEAPAAGLSMQQVMEHLTGTAVHGSP